MNCKQTKPGIPPASERPDLYDGYDFGQGSVLSKEYSDAICPPHIKKLIAERKHKTVPKS